MEEFTTNILGKRWRIVPADGLKDRYGVDGDCDPPGARRKSVRYEPTLGLWDLVETVSHECHHAAFPSTSEEDVTQYNRDLRRVLERVLTQRFDITPKEPQP